MKKLTLFLAVTFLALGTDSSCIPGPFPTATPTPVAPTVTQVVVVTVDTPIPTLTSTFTPTNTPTPTDTSTPTSTPKPTYTPVPTATPIPVTFAVSSTADSGPGTLRQALLDAKQGDIITFDPEVFTPTSPVTIILTSGLPEINQGNLIIDASDAGVILDGNKIVASSTNGLTVNSNGNTIRGLQIVGFPYNGIALVNGAQRNTIGGDRSIGSGPLGQGNLLSGNTERGIILLDRGTSFNIIVGNYIGTDVSGTKAWGNGMNGLHMNGASHNRVIDNLISGNDGFGIDLCCSNETNNNEISGNFIGTDVSGKAALGNKASGITVHDGANDNVIGPDNIIAYNDGHGVDVRNPGSLRNNIIQNSIHDNKGIGIDLEDGGNTELAAPLIFDFDLEIGSVTGTGCANCAVMVFSDSGSEGRVYEGQAICDTLGAFAFNKGSPFAGPWLTATATDMDGNTSGFSVPTAGTRRSTILQAGNGQPKSRLQTKRSNELADNHIGGGIWSNLWQIQDFQGLLDEILGIGSKRVKLTINDGEAQTIFPWGASKMDWSKPELSIDPVHDQFITDIASNGIIITYWLTFWDKANHPEGWQPAESRFKTEEEIERYLDYVRFIVRHFKDRIQYYEIWNEPDNTVPLQWIHVDDYINLVRRTVPVIREECPEAKIVVGSIVLQNPSSRDWLFNLLRSDVMPLVDAVSWHPMFGVSPKHNGQYYYEYPSLVEKIRNEASAHGFEGEYRGDELTWRSPDCSWCNPNDPLESNIAAAKYYARGIVMHLGMDITPGVGGTSTSRLESYSTIRNLCTLMAGAKPASIPIEIQSGAANIRWYWFSLPNGDKLVALWTDGIAVDDDPGVKSTLIVPGFSAQTVMGIDVLNGFEQPMITSTEGGNLVIRNLLIKDYPIILRLTK